MTTDTLVALLQKNKIEHSGDPHEYLNGKHIKDWEGKGIAIVDGIVYVDDLTDEQMKVIRARSISNGSGNIL